MKTPKFTKTIRENDVLIGLSVEDVKSTVFMCHGKDGAYMDFSKPMTEIQILEALAQAYSFGYEMAVSDSQEAVRRVVYGRKTAHAPKPKISIVTDYTK